MKTLSRSFSVLAPWRPKHYRETLDIDYTQYPKPPTRNGKYEQKVAKNGSSRKENASTLKKKAQETKRSNQNNASTLNRRSKSKENVSTLKRTKDETPRGSNSTLYKKKERQPKENNRYASKDEKKMSSKSMSVESLSGKKSREDNHEVSRSISIPRDPEKSAGWFKTNKKSKKTGNSQRLWFWELGRFKRKRIPCAICCTVRQLCTRFCSSLAHFKIFKMLTRRTGYFNCQVWYVRVNVYGYFFIMCLRDFV